MIVCTACGDPCEVVTVDFGIGAYEARELIRAMGGNLAVESREGLGSRFLIRLPRHAVSELNANPKEVA